MKLARGRRRESPETIIPLIDVVFFLLIFFMLIGRMDATAPFDVTPAIAQTGQDMPGGGGSQRTDCPEEGSQTEEFELVMHGSLQQGCLSCSF